MQIAVGGCLAQKDRDAVLRKAPWVDVVFGTHNIGSLPTLLERARHNREAQVEIVESLRGVPVRRCRPRANPPTPHGFPSRSAATTPARSASCPRCAARRSTAGPATSSPRCESLVDQGVLEVTLLGPERQRLRGVVRRPATSRATAARSPQLLRACGRIDGLERVRFTSPHPAEFTDDVIEAMAETPNVCPALHMPLQSGSDRMLRAMRRSYRAERYLGIIDRVRAAIPHAAITTDIIVGFPGETEEDFQATLDVVRRGAVHHRVHLPVLQAARHPGRRTRRPAAQSRCAGTLSAADRAAGARSRWRRTPPRSARTVELLVATGEGRKDARTARMTGRARDGRLVHFTPGDAASPARRHRHHHRHRRRAAPPDRRRRAADAPAHPRRRRARRRAAPAAPSGSACPGSACPRAQPTTRDVRDDRTAATSDFDDFKGDIEAAERRVARRDRSRRDGLGRRDPRVRAAGVVHPAAHRRRPGLSTC